MQHIKSCIIYILTIAIVLTSCDSKDKSKDSVENINDDFIGVSDIIPDSIYNDNVSRECAVICYKIDQIANKASSVNSPSSLIDIKKKYNDNLANAASTISSLDAHEQSIANEHKREAEDEYKKVCKEYEIPASGVLANLRNLIKRIDQVKTKEQFERFRDCRIGMLEDLDDIHLCIEHNSSAIPEVKKLAQTLKNKYEEKKHQFDLQ